MSLSRDAAEYALGLLVPGPARDPAAFAGTEDEARGLVRAIERHGLLGFAARERAAFEAALPDSAVALARERLAVGVEEARRDRATLVTVLEVWRAAGIEPLLLKGAGLLFDVYPDPGWRRMGDLDLLVEESEVTAVLRASAPLGLVPPPEALPAWWYRLTHFHLKLAPATALQREVEVHWALHHSSTLFTIDGGGLRARAHAIEHAEFGRARTLAHEDRFLHLATHLASHALGGGAPFTRADLQQLVGEERPLVRLKWLVDLHAVAAAEERPNPELVLTRAREWGALSALAFAVRSALALAPNAWLEALVNELPVATGQRDSLVAAAPASALDFRASRVGELWRWMFPRGSYLRRRGRRGVLGAPVQAASVLGRAALAACAFVPALMGRRLLASSRERSRASVSPERILDLAAGWRGR